MPLAYDTDRNPVADGRHAARCLARNVTGVVAVRPGEARIWRRAELARGDWIGERGRTIVPTMTDPDPPGFDAIAAARELDDFLAESSAPSTDVARLEAEVLELSAALAKKDAELARANVRAEHAHAEIEAAGKRLANASAKELEQRTRKVLESFLPVLDDLDRAVAAAAKHVESADVVEGLSLVRRSLLARLAQFGVVHAPALGEPFDPVRHEAMALVPVGDPAQDGRVIDVMREGYLIGDETLRPAGVAVGRRAG
jgi:molecular chaperone GrpE